MSLQKPRYAPFYKSTFWLFSDFSKNEPTKRQKNGEGKSVQIEQALSTCGDTPPGGEARIGRFPGTVVPADYARPRSPPDAADTPEILEPLFNDCSTIFFIS